LMSSPRAHTNKYFIPTSHSITMTYTFSTPPEIAGIVVNIKAQPRGWAFRI